MALRVRWGNVGRAAGGLALVGLVVAWPRLAGPVPVAPGAVERPVAGVVAAAQPRAVPGRAVTPRKRRVAPPRKRRGRRTAHVGRDRIGVSPRAAVPAPVAPPDAPPAAVAPAPAPTPTVAPPAAPAPTVDAAEREFGFER